MPKFFVTMMLMVTVTVALSSSAIDENNNSNDMFSERTCYLTEYVGEDWTKQLVQIRCRKEKPHCITLTNQWGKNYGCWRCPNVGVDLYVGNSTAHCCDTDLCNKPKPFNCHFRETENDAWDKCEADGMETFCAAYYDDHSVGKCTNECKNRKLNVRIENGQDEQGRDRPMMCCDTEMCNMPKPTKLPEEGDH